MSKLEEASGLWLGEQKDGVKFMRGKVHDRIVLEPGTKLFVFRNGHKKEDRHPDYRLMLDDSEAVPAEPPKDAEPWTQDDIREANEAPDAEVPF